MIFGRVTDGYSNRVRKVYSQRMESYEVSVERPQAEEPMITFGPTNLDEVITPHDDTLVVRTTILQGGLGVC